MLLLIFRKGWITTNKRSKEKPCGVFANLDHIGYFLSIHFTSYTRLAKRVAVLTPDS